MKNEPIIIVPGEPDSIFFEIFFKSLKYKNYKSSLIIICSKEIFLLELKKYKFKKKILIIDFDNINNVLFDKNCLYLINIELKKSKKKEIQKKNIKKYLEKSFILAQKILKSKLTKKFLNGPINKENFLNRKFLGVTEYFSHKFKINKSAMLIYNKNLSVCPVTTHLPIKLISKKITKKLINDKLKIIDNFYKKYFNIKPKIAVAGLNPHCESISLYNEDKEIIFPAIKIAKKKKILVFGPFSADTIFLKQNRKKFNVILGMYHDQVLAPMKAIYEFDAINITMGLPFLRATPDHGPNIEMAGKNLSNPISLIRALEFLDKQ